MEYLNDKVVKELKEMFKDLKDEVTMVYFTQEMECKFCEDTRGLLTELADVSDKIKLEIYDFVKDKDKADEYGVDKIPATVIVGDKNRDIKFYGIPSGYEFSSLIDAIKLVSTGDNPLSDETRKFLDSLEQDVHLQVFVTPTCPYCPGAVILGHQMAFYSDKVKAEMVEATEFPELSVKYNVMGVPRTVINGTEFQEGAAPENLIVEKIKASIS